DLQWQLFGDAGGQIDEPGGAAADVGVHVGALLGVRDRGRAQSLDELFGGFLGGAGRRDRVEVGGRPRLVDLNRCDRRDPRGGGDVFLERLQARIAGARIGARARRAGRGARARGLLRAARRRRLGRGSERDRDEQRPVDAGSEIVGQQVVGFAGGGGGGQRGDVLLPEFERQQRDRQRQQ